MSEISSSCVSQLSEELTKCTQQLHLAGNMGVNLLEDKRKLEERMELLRNQYSKLLEVKCCIIHALDKLEGQYNVLSISYVTTKPGPFLWYKL